MHTRYFVFAFAAALFPVLSGCAATLAPRELLDARQAFAQASGGAAARYNPADLEVARQSLVLAEQSFKDAPESQATRDLSYVAAVKSATAESRGMLTASVKAREAAEEQYKLTAGYKIDSKTAALANQTARTQMSEQSLAIERQRRADAEKRMRDALEKLGLLAAVKEEPRGLVITLSGSVLFATDKSELLPTAAARLNDVASALIEQPDRNVTVFGFTDSRGAAEHNQDLSDRRARSVRDYLISRGVTAERLSAVGKGPNEPVADNTSAEGRANNRRVEIVLAPSAAVATTSTYSP